MLFIKSEHKNEQDLVMASGEKEFVDEPQTAEGAV